MNTIVNPKLYSGKCPSCDRKYKVYIKHIAPPHVNNDAQILCETCGVPFNVNQDTTEANITVLVVT